MHIIHTYAVMHTYICTSLIKITNKTFKGKNQL